MSRKSRLGVAGLFILMVSTGIAILWWPKSAAPPPENEFVRGIRLTQISDGSELSAERIQVPADRGLMVRIEYVPKPNPPAAWRGQPVSPDDVWPLVLAFYPNMGLATETCQLSCLTFRRFAPGRMIQARVLLGASQGPSGRPLFVGTPLNWHKKYGYTGQPTLDAGADGAHLRWTFLPPPVEELKAGDYIYEIRLYPTARWASSVRMEIGEPVVVQRGLLTLGSS